MTYLGIGSLQMSLRIPRWITLNVEWALSPMVGILILVRWRQDTGWYIRERRSHANMEAETEVIPTQPRDALSHQKLEEARKDSSLCFWESMALATPWFQIPNILKPERINFCSISHPVCGNFYGLPKKRVHQFSGNSHT